MEQGPCYSIAVSGDVTLIPKCRRCGHPLLAEDFYCPSCGAQRDFGEVVP